MPTVINTLAESIARSQDLSDVQNQSTKAVYGDRLGVIVAEISVAALMAQQGVAALAIGTHKLKIGNQVVANANNHEPDYLFVPKGAILLAKPMVYLGTAKAGAGTGTINIASTALDTVLAAAGTAGIPDDGAGNVFVEGYLLTADSDISLVVTVGTLTAGSATVVIRYMLSNTI